MTPAASTNMSDRIKTMDTIIKWILAIVISLLTGAIWIMRMHYIVTDAVTKLSDHDHIIYKLDHNDAENGIKIDQIKTSVDRIEHKLDIK